MALGEENLLLFKAMSPSRPLPTLDYGTRGMNKESGGQSNQVSHDMQQKLIFIPQDLLHPPAW